MSRPQGLPRGWSPGCLPTSGGSRNAALRCSWSSRTPGPRCASRIAAMFSPRAAIATPARPPHCWPILRSAPRSSGGPAHDPDRWIPVFGKDHAQERRSTMMLAQSIADGILTGAIVALGAIGVSLALQILRFANFAHAELMTWGAYFALAFVSFAGAGASIGPLSFGWQLIAALVLSAALTGVLAWVVDLLIFRRLRVAGAHSLSFVFASFGAALI